MKQRPGLAMPLQVDELPHATTHARRIYSWLEVFDGR
jgi:hypothetical protein